VISGVLGKVFTLNIPQLCCQFRKELNHVEQL
jgi:hypothetical protein